MRQLWIEHTKSLKRTASKFSQSNYATPNKQTFNETKPSPRTYQTPENEVNAESLRMLRQKTYAPGQKSAALMR